MTERVDEWLRASAGSVRVADRGQERLRAVSRCGRVEERQAGSVEHVVASSKQRFVLLRRPGPVRPRVRLVPDHDSARMRDECECRAVRRRQKRACDCASVGVVASEAEDRKDDLRLRRCRLAPARAPSATGPVGVASPLHGTQSAHGLHAERPLPANDAERVGRPLERVVVDAHEQSRGRPRPQREPRRCRRDDEQQRSGDQPPLDTSPRTDCRSTRQPVATTVRR